MFQCIYGEVKIARLTNLRLDKLELKVKINTCLAIILVFHNFQLTEILTIIALIPMKIIFELSTKLNRGFLARVFWTEYNG